MNIRNFCIVSHIDHGKSTLADRILEYTNSVPKNLMKEQVLDRMDLERERGITIRSKTIRIEYKVLDDKTYILNLVDTPGHVDFSYEVCRAMICCEGAILLVDASQGVEAQTLANTYLAKKIGLKIVPVINKIDLLTADVQESKKQIKNVLGVETEPILCSAKDGTGIEEIMESIISQIPPPEGDPAQSLEAVVFDSFYDSYRAGVIFTRVFSGELKPGKKIVLVSSKKEYEIQELGYLYWKMSPAEKLSAGEVGYVIAGIKNIHDIKTGDTIVEKDSKTTTYSGLGRDISRIKPFVFAGIYPINPGEYDSLRTALEKLHLTDSSFQYSPVNSSALGPGFHCGFLGTLHLEITQERLTREYNLDLIITSPNVVYQVKTPEGELQIDNPAKFPEWNKIDLINEPYVKATIVVPNEYLSPVIELSKNKRGKVVEVRQLDSKRVLAYLEMPLAEIIVGFYDSLKSVSKGYASFDYEHIGYKPGALVKLEVLVNNEPVDAFAYVVHELNAKSIGYKIIEKLKNTIPRQLFSVALQIRIKNKIIIRDDIRAARKDVLAKCYGGDVTRKRKLLEKQKEGKKRMKQFGKVEIPQETFFALLKVV